MEINEKLRTYLYEKGLKQNAIARQSSIEPKRFNRIILGKANMRIDELDRVCRTLDLSIQFFLSN